MPSYWTGTLDERLARLDRIGRRCDGNSARCPNPAVEEYELFAANGFGTKLPDAELEKKKVCGRHRLQYLASGRWIVVSDRELARSPDTQPRTTAAAHVRFPPTDSSWVAFVDKCNEIQPGIFGIESLRKTGKLGVGGCVEYRDARIVHSADRTVIISALTEQGNVTLREAGSRLDIIVYV